MLRALFAMLETAPVGASKKRYLSVQDQAYILRKNLRDLRASRYPLYHSLTTWAPFPLLFSPHSLQQSIAHGFREFRLLSPALGTFDKPLACCDLAVVGLLILRVLSMLSSWQGPKRPLARHILHVRVMQCSHTPTRRFLLLDDMYR